jgi:very-short-patch-repair endonuclease
LARYFETAGNDVFICKICNPCGRNVKLLKDFLDEDKKKYFKQENNIGIDFSVLTFGSAIKINWTCPNNHVFNKEIKKFSSKTGSSCPKCRLLGMSNSKQFTLGQLSSNKVLMEEFSNKNILDPKAIALGDNRTKIWWHCKKCSNEWEARPYARNHLNSGCPSCNSKRNQSRTEIRLYSELKSLFTNVEISYKIKNYKYDIYIKDINLLIEYDGEKWHSDEKSILNDINKNKLAEDNGFDLVRIREKGLSKINNNDIILDKFNKNIKIENTQIYVLKKLICFIKKKYNFNFDNYIENYLDKNCFLNEKTYYLIFNIGFVKNNLTKHSKFHEFCKIKNKIKPECLAISSQIKVWWKCDKGKDHSWEENPANRKVGGCPYCSNKRISITNRFDIIEPKSIKLWSIKNKTRPSDYTFRNGKVNIIWNCNNCNKEFSKNIDKMIDTNGYCPHCKNYHFK